MARNRIHVDAAPAAVFAVPADARRYPDWVVGASDVADHHDHWPEVGARFEHRVGVGPLRLPGVTEVLYWKRPVTAESRRPRRTRR